MLLYSVCYKILGFNFKIITNSQNLLSNQIKHIAKFCYSQPQNQDLENPIILEYYENDIMFNSIKQLFSSIKYTIIQTFEKEIHYKLIHNSHCYFMMAPEKYIVEKVSPSHYIIIGDGQHDTTKYLFRIVREILVRLQENSNKLFMHGTAFVTNGKGIAILGNSGSGKTTLACKMLLTGKTKILSNDRIFIYSNPAIQMDYFPIPFVFKVGSVRNNKKLNSYIIQGNHYDLPSSFLSGEKSYPIPLTDMQYIFPGSEQVESSCLDLIVFSKINLEDAFCLNISELDTTSAIKLLENVCFTPFDTESLRREWIFERSPTVNTLIQNSNKIFHNITKSCKIVFVEFGKDINETILNETIMQLLRR